MSILNRTLCGCMPEQAAAPVAMALDRVVGESSNIRSLLNKLERVVNTLEERNEFLEKENAQLKEINAKLVDQLSSATTAPSAVGGPGDDAVHQPQGGQGTAVKENRQQPTASRDIPSRIEKIQGRKRKRKELSLDFTPRDRSMTRHYKRKQAHPVKIEGAEEAEEGADNVSGTIAEVLMEMKSDLADPGTALSVVDVDDFLAQLDLPGFIYERRRNYPGRDKISKDEHDTVNVFILRPIPKGPIWQNNSKESYLPFVTGQVLRDYLFGGPTSDEVSAAKDNVFCFEMHILNKMQGIRKEEALTGDFVRDVVFGSESIRHMLDKINTATCSKSRFLLIPVNSKWHWHLLSIDLKECRFESWNSLWSHTWSKVAARLLVLLLYLTLREEAKWFSAYFEHILQITLGAPDVIFRLQCQQ